MVHSNKELLIVKQSLENKQIHFMSLLKPQHDRLEKYCLSLTGNREDARDLLSEAILEAYQRLDQLKDKDKFPNYIFRIAKYTHLKKLRKFQWLTNDNPKMYRVIDRAPDPSDLMDIIIVYEALSKLPSKLKQAVILHEISGFPLKEVAEIENCSLSAAKARVMRGRNKLFRILSDQISENKTQMISIQNKIR